jgi:hypothetical protein
MTFLPLLAALAVQQSAQPTQPTTDTSVVVQGLLVEVPDDEVWLLALPSPFRFRGRTIGEIELSGNRSRWSKFSGHYVEARGRLAAWAGGHQRGAMQVEAVREVDPEGAVRKNISNSFTHRVSVSLWALPLRFGWLDDAGHPTGVGPVLVYSMNNHGESDLILEFQSDEFVCFSVEPVGGGAPPWRYRVFLDQPTDQMRVTLPKFVREVARLPRDGAPTAGRYTVRAGLCGFKEYEVETEIEVLR